jgi:hypothetical protein
MKNFLFSLFCIFAMSVLVRAGDGINVNSEQTVLCVDLQFNSASIFDMQVSIDSYLMFNGNDLGILSDVYIMNKCKEYIVLPDIADITKARYRCHYTHKSRDTLHYY